MKRYSLIYPNYIPRFTVISEDSFKMDLPKQNCLWKNPQTIILRTYEEFYSFQAYYLALILRFSPLCFISVISSRNYDSKNAQETLDIMNP